MSLAGRVALVSGASRGIGRSIALALAEDGADVAVNFRRDEAAAAEVVGRIEAMGRRALAVRASVDDFEADAAMVEQTVAQLGPIGILVHNPGVASRGRSVEETEPGELLRVIGTHALPGHYLCRKRGPDSRE